MNRMVGRPVAAALAALAAPAFAHDFWIEPSTFRPEPGSVVSVGLRIGEGFQGEPVKRNSERFEGFALYGPGGAVPVPGTDGADPAGNARIEKPGVYVIGYRSTLSSIELEPKDFEAYLKEEGLERILTERAKRGESNKPAREVYSRCAKAIVISGTDAKSGHDRAVGYPLELIPETNPATAKAGEELTFRLLLNGKPLAVAQVVALNREDGKNPVRAVTDKDGKAVLRLPKPGVWLVKTVHMFPASPTTQADWESLWASITFELP